MTTHRFFATAGRGISALLAEELRALGARRVSRERSGAAFTGTLETAYRVCLWSRLANRVLLPLAAFDAPDADALYAGVREVPWIEHLDATRTIAVDATTRDAALTHTRFIAQRVKDAVVDVLRERTGARPSVSPRDPDLRLNLHLDRDRATLALDLSGDSLHRRGYRLGTGDAPIKENLAAAIVLRAGWPQVHARGETLLDPMCGSGTLVIEAAMMACDVAPGLTRGRFGFERWFGHDASCWDRLHEEALERRREGLARPVLVYGSDADPEAIRLANANAARAGLERNVRLTAADLTRAPVPEGARTGLAVANPPYGERLGAGDDLAGLYAALGRTARERFRNWRLAVFTGNPTLARHLALGPARRFALANGAIACELLCFDPPLVGVGPGGRRRAAPPPLTVAAATPAPMLANRLRKNLRTIGAWARRAGVECYRLYDADMPEYAVAVDLYRSDALWAHVQEYAAPPTIEPERAAARLADAVATIGEVLELPRDRIVLKQRRRGHGGSRYGAMGEGGEEIEVREGSVRLLVNLTDRIDTGLFLDSREIRATVARHAPGQDFLNLFAYTGAASVHAAAAGARSSLSVDLSAGNLAWTARNLALNGFGPPAHACVQADCLTWLRDTTHTARYGLILLDPPTFSNSKRMDADLDVQRDHARLIGDAARLLDASGLLVFVTNLRRFSLDAGALTGLAVEELTGHTVPRDFARRRGIHHAYAIRRLSAAQAGTP